MTARKTSRSLNSSPQITADALFGPAQQRALEVFSRSVAPGAQEAFSRFIAKQTVMFAERAALSNTLARQDEALPTEVVSSLNDTELFWRAVQDEFGLLSSLEVAQALGASANRSYASDLRKSGRVVALQRLNRFVFPGFQFVDGEVREVIADLKVLGQQYGIDDRDIVAWLCRPTTYLDVRAPRPVDHLDDPDVVRGAAAAAWGVAW